MPEFPGNPNLRQLLAVHSTRNGVPLEDRIKDGTAPPPVEEPPADVSRETPSPEGEPEPQPPAAAKRRR